MSAPHQSYLALYELFGNVAGWMRLNREVNARS